MNREQFTDNFITETNTILQAIEPPWNVEIFKNDFKDVLLILTPTEYSLIVFIFLSLGLIAKEIVPVVKCAAQQNMPDFMSMQILHSLEQYKIKFSIILHNRAEDTFVGHIAAFIEWKSKQDMILKANVHIYPSREMFNQGIVENTLLLYLPRSMMEHNNFIPSYTMWDNWDISSVLTFINRQTSQKLEFYIKHLFQNRLSPNWASEDYNLGANIIDLRGIVISKINEYTVNLTSFNGAPIDLNNLPVALDNFIDVVNETWLPLLI